MLLKKLPSCAGIRERTKTDVQALFSAIRSKNTSGSMQRNVLLFILMFKIALCRTNVRDGSIFDCAGLVVAEGRKLSLFKWHVILYVPDQRPLRRSFGDGRGRVLC